MDIEARSKDKWLAVNEDILTKIKMELKGVWKVYIRTDRYFKEFWFNLWPLPQVSDSERISKFYLTSSLGSSKSVWLILQ